MKHEYETRAHAADGYVRKDDPLIRFRGALDHAEAEVILTQAKLLQRRALEEGRAAENTDTLLRYLQELLDLLRAIMTAEYTGDSIDGVPADGSAGTFRLFGYTLDELQERSHNAQSFYGVPTMTRPDAQYGETYARLNLIRTELRQLESEAVALFCEAGESADTDPAVQPTRAAQPARPDLLYLLNRLSSAAHCLMCWWLGKTLVKEA